MHGREPAWLGCPRHTNRCFTQAQSNQVFCAQSLRLLASDTTLGDARVELLMAGSQAVVIGLVLVYYLQMQAPAWLAATWPDGCTAFRDHCQLSLITGVIGS